MVNDTLKIMFGKCWQWFVRRVAFTDVWCRHMLWYVIAVGRAYRHHPVTPHLWHVRWNPCSMELCSDQQSTVVHQSIPWFWQIAPHSQWVAETCWSTMADANQVLVMGTSIPLMDPNGWLHLIADDHPRVASVKLCEAETSTCNECFDPLSTQSWLVIVG